jgi:hypothetical protein
MVVLLLELLTVVCILIFQWKVLSREANLFSRIGARTILNL